MDSGTCVNGSSGSLANGIAQSSTHWQVGNKVLPLPSQRLMEPSAPPHQGLQRSPGRHCTSPPPLGTLPRGTTKQGCAKTSRSKDSSHKVGLGFMHLQDWRPQNYVLEHGPHLCHNRKPSVTNSKSPATEESSLSVCLPPGLQGTSGSAAISGGPHGSSQTDAARILLCNSLLLPASMDKT